MFLIQFKDIYQIGVPDLRHETVLNTFPTYIWCKKDVYARSM